MHTGWGFLAVDKGDDVWVVEASKDRDLRHEVILQLLIELVHVDRFDGHRSFLLLVERQNVSSHSIRSITRPAIDMHRRAVV